MKAKQIICDIMGLVMDIEMEMRLSRFVTAFQRGDFKEMESLVPAGASTAADAPVRCVSHRRDPWMRGWGGGRGGECLLGFIDFIWRAGQAGAGSAVSMPLDPVCDLASSSIFHSP